MRLLFLLICVSIGLSACGDTMRGAGKDIEDMGESIQKTFE